MLSSKVIDFLNELDDSFDDFIDRVELQPFMITTNLYLTGFRRSSTNVLNKAEAHLKRIKLLKMTIDGKEGYELMETPEEEIWLDVDLLDDGRFSVIFEDFKDNFYNLTSLHILHTTYKDKGSPLENDETILFEDKRVACKTALEYRRKHDMCKTTFKHFGEDGTISFSHGSEPSRKKKVMSDFEMVLASSSELEES